MPRRLGATVPQTVSRLLQGGLLPQPPAWFTAVTSIAPVRPSLTKRVPRQDPEPSTSTSTSSRDPYAWKGPRKIKSARQKVQLKYRPAKPAEIKGLELQDQLRQTFYKDHPFEAFTGINLVEQDKVLTESAKPGPAGVEWTELRQRSSNPSPEDCVDFVINLHKMHELPLAIAYSTGIAQYHALKASHEIALYSAQVELQAQGYEWPTEFSVVDRRVRADEKNILESVRAASKLSMGDSAASGGAPRVSLLKPLRAPKKAWTGGLQYLTGKESKAFRKDRQASGASAMPGSGTGFGNIKLSTDQSSS